MHHIQDSDSLLLCAVPFWDIASKLTNLSIEKIDPEERRSDTAKLRRHYPDQEDTEDEETMMNKDWDRFCRQTMLGQLDDTMSAVFLESFLPILSPEDMEMYSSPRRDDAVLKDHPPPSAAEERRKTSFRLPASPVAKDDEALKTLHDSILCRTIVAAAKGGKLKSLNIADRFYWTPFMIGGLLQYWVGVEHWYLDTLPQDDGRPMHPFHKAASELRTALAHASIWITPRNDRLLTSEDLRGWFAKYKAKEVAARVERFPELELYNAAIEFYIYWLQEHAALAQQVSDALNAVVERGEADRVKCTCDECKGRWK